MVEGLTIKRVSTSDQVATALREKIFSGELRPGTPLQEVAMAASVGVSRNTLREAIRQLVHEGLVRHSVHRGAAVTELSEQDIADIYQIRMMLETAGVKAARHVQREQLDKLAAIVDQIRAAVESRNWALSVDRDLQFHRHVVGFLGSRRLSLFYHALLTELRLALVLMDSTIDTTARLVTQHEQLLRLLRTGNYAECAKLLRAHLVDSEELLRTTLSAQSNRR
jgi:DNA-binding GntR family transcriptional regulator